jgi:dienelactone hydrolase
VTSFPDFSTETFSAEGTTRTVYRAGTGRCVVVLSEMPGITPALLDFARLVVAHGCSVVIPHLFGVDGESPSPKAFRTTTVQVCVSREFTLFALNRTSRITTWLNALAHREHERAGGPGVGVVGMCLTGGFALAMMVDPVVVAPVLSQPSLPVGRSARRRRALGLSDRDLARAVERSKEGQCVLGARFTNDPLVPAERFASLREALGDKFIGVEIDSSPTNTWAYPEDAHSVLTGDFFSDAASPTAQWRTQVLDFFATQLEV